MTSSVDPGPADRLGVLPAPGGLRLVQDLLNSAAVDAFAVPDLLAGPGAAEDWCTASVDAWARAVGRPRPALALGDDDLPVLRDVRHRVRAWLGGEGVDLPSTTVVLQARGGGEVAYAPAGSGADGVWGLVAAELLLAERDGTLERLRTCANPACGAAFYDRSRNGSRVWHDVRTCGNVANLRASRARRRAEGGDAGSPAPAR